MTEQDLIELHEKAMAACRALYGIDGDDVIIDSDGEIEVTNTIYGCCGDPDEIERYRISLDQLDMDLEALEAERKAREERERLQLEARRKAEIARRQATEKEYRKQQYLALKKEFE